MNGAAVVTGASSGIGLEISRTLCGLGYEVFGFGRDFTRGEVLEGGFHKICCDILDTEKMTAQIRQIKGQKKISLLVNNAGIGYYGLHEELNPKKIQEMVRTNLEVPMVLTNLLLRDLKETQGWVINISSVTAAESNPHGCAYGATKAGLTSFSHSLFDEARKYGVRAVNIEPDMTKTNLYRNADFAESEEIKAYLLPEEVAQAVAFVLSRREGMVVTDLVLKPQFHRIKRKDKYNRI